MEGRKLVYLDGVNLPDEVYKNSDVNVVIEELNKRIEGHGEMQSHWQGNTETGLCFYGDDANRMIALMQDFLDTYPLCKGARVVEDVFPVSWWRWTFCRRPSGFIFYSGDEGISNQSEPCAQPNALGRSA
jgi:hypothetical protein